MIVKKMPIIQGFPDFESVKNLSFPRIQTEDFRPVFYDIETTGLSRNSTFFYLAGAVVFEQNDWQMYQWLGENKADEKLLLETFSAFLESFTCTIQYNGDRFDQPYLEARCGFYGLSSPFGGKPSLDLYRCLKPLKALLKLPQMKQPELERFLGFSHREFCDGRECIRLYRSYAKDKAPKALETVMGHNREDLEGLGRIFSMLGYLSLYEGGYQVSGVSYDGERLIFRLGLPYELPVPFSNGSGGFYITGQGREVRLSVTAADGRIRQYYKNYKDYDYLPAEDTAIPKALSAYMERSLRTPARPDTCYTWFPCGGDFLEDSGRQLQYLSHSLPYLLSVLD